MNIVINTIHDAVPEEVEKESDRDSNTNGD